MVIETAAYFGRRVRSAAWFLIGALSLCGVAAAQTPPAVTTGSVIQLPHVEFNQIYKVVYWQGNVLLLDTASSILYQLAPGSTTFTSIATPANSPLSGAGDYWNMDMTIDKEGTLYIDERYGTSNQNGLFFRVPYNPSSKSWAVTANDGWGATIEASGGSSLLSDGSDCVAFMDSGKGDGSGTLYWQTELSPVDIYEQQVGANGALVGSATPVVIGLKVNQGRMAMDARGNIFFVENGANGAEEDEVYFVPGGSTNLAGESALTELIPPSVFTGKFNGAGLDPAGNLYLSINTGAPSISGVVEIPNSCGNDAHSASCYDFNNASYVSPVGGASSVAVDPRGFLWIPSYGNFTYGSSSPYGGGENSTTDYCTGGACNVVLWAMGSDNLGASPVGTVSATGTVFVNFNTAITPGAIGFSQPGTASDFATTTTNPYPNSAATTPTTACTAGTVYTPMTSCPVWVTMTPQTTGPISGELTMKDSSGNPISGSTTYLSGVGQGPMAALLGIPQQTAMAAGLSTPAQAAVDTLGNVYVADPGLGKVLEYAAGSSGATGVSIGSGLSAPTGVAVDGSGDVYIGDSGSIYEIPFVGGKLDTAGQVTLATSDTANNLPLGSHLNLAVDGSGDVYAADPDDTQVVKVDNPAGATTQTSYTVVGTGFTAPSAVAVDNSGDLFVADGTNLDEITPWGGQSLVDTTLSSPVTGLAVEPSGAVDVAQKGGILRIPFLAGSFAVNDAIPIDTVQTEPNSVAIDGQGNLYATDMTGGTPNLYELNVTNNAAYDFGQVGAYVAQEQDVSVYNIGNEPLTFTTDPTFSDNTDFSLVSPTLSPCDTTGATTVASGGSCAFGVQIDAQVQQPTSITSSMSVTSSATNGTATATLTAAASITLEPTAVSLSLNPATTTFPGSTTATVTILQSPIAGNSTTTNVPDGTVTITLTSGSTQHVFTGTATGTDAGTTATINLTSLLGGTYNVRAVYKGNANYGGGTATATLIVAQAPASIAVGEPSGIQPNSTNGVYYVLVASNTTLSVTVSSGVGTPTGTITFMNGSQPADPTQVNQPLDANGQVTFNLENLTAGTQPGGVTYNLTAVYSGDTNFATETSAPITFQVIEPSVLLSASPASLSTPAGTPVSSTITLQSLVGLSASGGVNITCDNTTLPQYSECTFNNPQPEFCAAPGTSTCFPTTTTVVTLSTNIPVNVGSLRTQTSPFALAGVFSLGLLGLGLRKRKLISRGMFQVICLTLLLAGSIAGFTGCTNSGYTHTPPAPHEVTPSGSYNVSIVVTNEASGYQYSLPFTLPVTIK